MHLEPVYADAGDARLARLAARQHGVVGLAQLLALGYTRHMVHRLLGQGWLHRLYPGVYAVGHRRLNVRGRWMAAVLACGEGAVLSHRSAAALHDLQAIPGGLIAVTATTRHHLPGICCHWARRPLDRADVTVIDGIAVTRVARLMLDMAEVVSEQRLGWLAQAAERQDKLDLLAVEAVMARSPGRHGHQPLSRVLGGLQPDPPWAQSDLERAFLALVGGAGLPQPALNVVVAGVVVDAVFWAQRLVVEVDGWQFHKTRRSFEQDRRRDIALQIAGYRVIRLTHQRIMHEPQAVARELTLLLSQPIHPEVAR
jgi:hypothetical protein